MRARPRRLPRGWSYLAVSRHGKLLVYPRRGATHPSATFTNATSAGSRLTLLVRHRRPGWFQVYLPVRPNGSTGWIHAADVKLVTTAYAITVQLHSHRPLLAKSGLVVRTFSIGVGRSVTPTPTGKYYITELLKQPNPNGLYGPYAFGLSAYSGVLQQFGRGGNGQVGIHGTNEPSLVGTDVSHGCIRLRNSDIVWLTKRLALGTPVIIDRA